MLFLCDTKYLMKRSLSIPVLALAAAVAAPAAGHADPLTIFQPTRVRPVSVTPADARALQALPPLEAFGTLHGTRSPGVEDAASAQDASEQAGYALRLPSGVPAGLAKDVHYEVTGRARATFTFERAKAATWARENGVALRPLPSGLDGSTFTATLSPVAIVIYGTPPRGRRADRGARRGNFLAVVQAPVPTISSSGASLAALESWIVAQPGIPPHLREQVRALGDPSQTLPIPIRFDKQTATRVTVDGVDGLAIGDETGIGSAVVWTKGGRLYAVGGTLPQSALMTLAGSLHE